MRVLIDDREPKNMQKLALEAFDDAEVLRLPAGDYVCGNIAIERKEAVDFSSSVNDGRLSRQCKDLVANFDIPIVVLVATDAQIYGNPYFKLHVNRFIGARTDLHHRKVRFDRVANDKEFIRFCESMFKKAKDIHIDINEIKKVAPRNGDPYVGMIRQVPGIGEKKARDILKQFKVYELWDVTEKDLRSSVNGVGVKQAKAIKRIFTR